MASPPLLVFKIFRGSTPVPPFKIRKYMYVIYFQSNTAQHKPLVQSEVFKLGSKQQQLFSIDLW